MDEVYIKVQMLPPWYRTQYTDLHMQTSPPLVTLIDCRGSKPSQKQHQRSFGPLASLITTNSQIIVLGRRHISQNLTYICPRPTQLVSLSLYHISPLSPQTSHTKKKSILKRSSHPANHDSCHSRKTWKLHPSPRKGSRETSIIQAQKPNKKAPARCRPGHHQTNTITTPPARSTGPRPNTSQRATTGQTSPSSTRGDGSRTGSHRGNSVSILPPPHVPIRQPRVTPPADLGKTRIQAKRPASKRSARSARPATWSWQAARTRCPCPTTSTS